MHFLSQVLKTFCLTVLVHDLFSQHVDLALKILILGLCLIETELLVLNSMLLAVQTNVVKLIFDSLGPNFLYILVLFRELVFYLLDLVLRDLKLTFLVLKLLGIDVDFSL